MEPIESTREATIATRKMGEKTALLEQLKKTPIIQIACDKSGVSRASYYRWRKEDVEFAKQADEAINHGTDLVSEMAESQLLAAIRDRNLTAIIFWLKHRHAAYRTRIEVEGSVNTIQELSPEQKELVRKALELTGVNLNPPSPPYENPETPAESV
jgi:hypothetical protein